MKYYILIIIILVILSYSIIPSRTMKILKSIQRKKSGNKIYLTFDDGPSSTYTKELLDLLKKYDVKATFFVVSDFAIENADIIKRMVDENHKVEYHSKSHKDAIILGLYGTYREVYLGIKNLNNIGIYPKYFRAPWGRYNLFSLLFAHTLKLKVILWDVMAEDWVKNTTPEEICNKIINRTCGGDIICLHDNRGFIPSAPSRTILALDKAIPILKEKGFEFEVIQ